MRNFERLAIGVDIGPLKHSLRHQEGLWNQFKVRTWHPQSAHRVIDDVVLRYNEFNQGDDFLAKVCSELRVSNYPAWAALPQARQIIFDLMRRVEAEELGRVFISRMAPGVEIPLHSDRIAPAEEAFPDKIPPAWYYDRYHVLLQSEPGVVFTCGEESVQMLTGEVWWFNNEIPHSVVNNSAEDRISLVVDLRVGSPIYVPS